MRNPDWKPFEDAEGNEPEHEEGMDTELYWHSVRDELQAALLDVALEFGYPDQGMYTRAMCGGVDPFEEHR